MKKINVSLTVKSVIEVPDDFPISENQIESSLDWKINDFNDGRFNFNTEMFFTGARKLINNCFTSAIQNHLFKVNPSNSNEAVKQRMSDLKSLNDQAYIYIDENKIYVKAE